MEIYILMNKFTWDESEEIVGVYSTREKAEQGKEDYKKLYTAMEDRDFRFYIQTKTLDKTEY